MSADPVSPGVAGEPVHVSVVIVSWRSRDVLVTCLESLAAHPPSCAWEAIVVDNASGDGTVQAVTNRFPWVRVIANRTNRGLAAANNQGLLASRGDTIVISNPDVVFTPHTLDALDDVLERRPRAAFVVPRLRQQDGSLQTGAGDLPTLREALTVSWLRPRITRSRRDQRAAGADGARSGFWWNGWSHAEERIIGHGSEACYAVRRAAVIEIGPQDERFPLDWEGIDWSARAWAAGWEVWFCPAGEVIHLGGVSIAQARVRWVVNTHRGIYRYFAPRLPPAARPVLAAAVTARAAAKLAAVAAKIPLYDIAHRTARCSTAPSSVESPEYPPMS